MCDSLVRAIDGDAMIPGNGLRLGLINTLKMSGMPIRSSRIQVSAPRHCRHVVLTAEQPQKTSLLPDGPVMDRPHRLPSHLSLPRRLLPHCFAAFTAHCNAMPMGIIRHLPPQILYTYCCLPRVIIMLTPTTTTLVLPIMM